MKEKEKRHSNRVRKGHEPPTCHGRTIRGAPSQALRRNMHKLATIMTKTRELLLKHNRLHHLRT